MIQHIENKYYEATGINYIDEAISAEIERNRLLSQLQESKKRGEETGLQQGLIQGKVKVFYN